jgi:hypothetical protein
MSGRAVQATIRHILGRSKGRLVDEIKELVQRQLLPKTMADWAEEVRALRNIGAHPDETVESVSEEDARAIVRFAGYFIQYMIQIPHEINKYRKDKT